LNLPQLHEDIAWVEV